jgi:hypothetical protein
VATRTRTVDAATVGPVGRRVGVGIASAALLLALAWPIVAPDELDSLPLSNYPMFAHPRERISHYYVAVLVDRDGAEHRLDLRVVGGTDQPVQAAMTLQQAIRAGEADALCAEIASKVDRPGRVEVQTVWYDSPAWFGGLEEPVDRVVHADCEVGA